MIVFIRRLLLTPVQYRDSMNMRFIVFASLLTVLSLHTVPSASGQSVVYPDDPGYEKFRRSEQDTLDALHRHPSRALAFRLLVAQRRLREAQLMTAKDKYPLVPALLKDYQETIQGITSFLGTLPLRPNESAGYFQTIEVARLRHQEVLKLLSRRVPADLLPSVEAALASSQKLRLLSLDSPLGEAGPTGRSAFSRGSHVSIQEPTAPVAEAQEESQPESPLYPAGTKRREILQPPETPPSSSPDDFLGHRLSPSETHTRGTRRPGDTHPRPRAREPIRHGDR
jgi:hypothetical protein